MAYKNKLISNPKTGQDIRFIQTGKDNGGKLLEMESTYNSYSKEPPPHYHPHHNEDFKVLEGKLTVRIEGQLLTLYPGDTLHVPANKTHSMWNNSKSRTVVNWKVHPATALDHFLETVTGLAADGKTNDDGVPNLLQAAMLANKYTDVFRLSRPAFFVQKTMFLILTPLAYLLGYRPIYKKYLD
jgi:quercetin dioxygenase-like cupin family protein